jgi:NTP pyrophosphatase (non-canonical NTP hydrolase)|tara:strand:+ start:127 stop:399 length:273 start_codon:yes stop_codon:yes gene_type:complete
MSNKVSEILDILQEECAEVIQNVSKCRRFGLNNVYLNGEGTQRENLVKEIGDVVAMIDLLRDHGILTDAELEVAKQNKFNKLRKWSKIYE